MKTASFIKKSVLITLVLLILGWKTSAVAANALLSWDANTETDLAGYKVYYGTSSRSYGAPVDIGNQTTFTVTGLSEGQTYYFSVTAYDTSGSESAYSDEVSKTFSDTTAPVLSAMAAGSITGTGAVITWTTNEPATAQVEYGTTTAYGASSALRGTFQTSHSRSLSNLAPSTLYHYRVISKDAANNTATSGDNTFTTAAAPDTTPPAISGIAAGNISPTSASVSWTTNELSDTQIQYGATSSYGSSTSLNTTMTTAHSQGLSGLTASTTYHYRVLSKDAAGNLATSGDHTFTTTAFPDTTPPTLSGITTSNLISTSVVIGWNTNEAATSQVEYGTTTAYGASSGLNTTLVTSHTRTLSNLSASTIYHFRVISKDGAGNITTSGDNTFTTPPLPDATTPTLSAITVGALTSGSATISWTTNEPADTQIQYGTTAGYGSTTSLNSTMTTSHSQTLTGLTASTLYHYRVLSKDAAGNLATSGDNLFTTPALPDTTAPTFSGVTAGNLTSASVVISWNTNEPATAQVEYGTTTAYGALSALDSAIGTVHTRTLNNLSPSTVYHFRVISKDAANNTARSGDNTFTTPATPDATGPVLSQITVGDIRTDRATVRWGTDEPATTQVEYGLTTAYGHLTTLNATLTNSHSEALSGLQAETVYHYRVRSADAAGNLSLSEDQTFTTSAPGDVTPPADIDDFTAIPGMQSITLGWVNPSDSDFAGVRILYRTDRYPTDLNDGVLLGDFTGQPSEPVSVIHAGLEGNVTYYYSASSYDSSGNLQNTAHAAAMPLGVAEGRSTSQSDGEASGGGCAMISPGKGNAGGPLDSAEWLGLVGLILAGLLRKRQSNG